MPRIILKFNEQGEIVIPKATVEALGRLPDQGIKLFVLKDGIAIEFHAKTSGDNLPDQAIANAVWAQKYLGETYKFEPDTAELERTEIRRQRLLNDGMSPAIIRLSMGDLPHPAFEYRCETPYKLDAGGEAPEGAEFVCLWESDYLMEGYWIKNGKLEFIGFDIESPEEYWLISNSQQGLLASIFMDLIEHENKDLENAASRVGFLYLDEVAALEQSTRDLADYQELSEVRQKFYQSLSD